MSWIYLFIAGLFEIVWAVTLKYTEGFTKLAPSALTLLAMGVSIYFLAIALKNLPIGTAYAVWTGIGAVGTALIGIFFLQESASLPRLFFLALIFTGILGLKFVSGE